MTALPIEPLIPEILATLAGKGRLVLQAPPGAGKTTRLPLALLSAPFLQGGKILVLEPRRLAARLAARYMAAQLGEGVGEQVGYRVRLDSKVGPKTRIELVTDGLFLRHLQEDPGLTGVACVLFDEFHERGLESDLALALTLEAATLNTALKLVVMSATLDAAPIARLLGNAPVLTSQGRAFPVETHYLAAAPEGHLEETVARAVRRALSEDDGSLLVFLPGQAEIRRTVARLEERALPAGVSLWPLYGELDLKTQDAAIKPAPPGQRKVVLATSIAETSLTIEGIRVVIDSGLARQPRYDPRSGMTRLETLRASQATAEQRRGRAGRLMPGVCYRLWTEADQRARAPRATPEIATADLAPFALELASWGAGSDLALLDAPPPGALAQARALLKELGALDDKGSITKHGRAMAALGLHPRLSHMILAAPPTLTRLACDIAALLSERDLLKGPPVTRPADLRLRLELLRGERLDGGAGVERGALAQLRQLAGQWARQVKAAAAGDVSDRAGEVLALAYPDRLAQARGARGSFRLANGKGAKLAVTDNLAAELWLAVASLDGVADSARIFLAAPLALADLERLFAAQIVRETQITWDSRAEAVVAVLRRRLGALVLEERALTDAEPGLVAAALAEGLRSLGLAALPWGRDAQQLRERLAFLHRHRPDSWPAVSDEALLADLTWLSGQLVGKTRRSHLAQLDLVAALMGLLTHQQRRDLERLAPAAWPVPTGRAVTLDYSAEAPVLAVKLQELFGQKTTPSLLDGKVPLLIHLLSPAGRPVQVTRDLEGFWRGSYAQVRADLRGRYPRHPWPDDPTTAPPQRGVKR